MNLNRIYEAADYTERDNIPQATIMLCCFAKLIQECRYTSEGNVAIDNMLSWFFEKCDDDFNSEDIKEIQEEIADEQA
jgi:hypothetical protein